ncbi:hypothetical protein D0B54_15605 [Solimonas sp. K1W22B-7]|uniref:hypothetical protein n=1 Tax=Solimonas sp. K1W22B-7 TaxID=2303331 RepID=UPI000E32F66D|nr:hypothetical protein [Solimonas sp. K1W22B-7]AXQ30011.1 hypothetical protein D0B54_15605 [Solimonas sp. K1W22B-7]
MRSRTKHWSTAHRSLWLLAAAWAGAAGAAPTQAAGEPAAALAATYEASAERLRNSPFRRPLILQSAESGDSLKGEIHALLDRPLAVVSGALSSPEGWCEVMMVHPNVAGCRVSGSAAAPKLTVDLGTRLDSSDSPYHAEFDFRRVRADDSYLQLCLDADKGPVGTHDYRILVEAVPVGDKTFLHFSYSYAYGFTARMATQAYLSTKGRSKVGFTPEGEGYIGGLRGAVERNAMRYYLAIESHLAERAAPESQRFERGLQRWLDAIAEYPRQLKEEGTREEYVTIKRDQYRRQQVAVLH